MADAPRSLKKVTDSPARSGESNKISPVPFSGGSGIVYRVTSEIKARVPSAPTRR